MNYKKGITRLSIVLTVLVGAYGSFNHYVFIPNHYLYGPNFQSSILKGLEHEIDKPVCNSGTLGYIEEASGGEFKIVKYSIYPKENNGNPFKDIGNECPNYENLAAILGKERIDRDWKKNVGSISLVFVKNELDSINRDIKLNIIKGKTLAAIEAIIYLWVSLAVLLASWRILKWVYRGFKDKSSENNRE